MYQEMNKFNNHNDLAYIGLMYARDLQEGSEEDKEIFYNIFDEVSNENKREWIIDHCSDEVEELAGETDEETDENDYKYSTVDECIEKNQANFDEDIMLGCFDFCIRNINYLADSYRSSKSEHITIEFINSVNKLIKILEIIEDNINNHAQSYAVGMLIDKAKSELRTYLFCFKKEVERWNNKDHEEEQKEEIA